MPLKKEFTWLIFLLVEHHVVEDFWVEHGEASEDHSDDKNGLPGADFRFRHVSLVWRLLLPPLRKKYIT